MLHTAAQDPTSLIDLAKQVSALGAPALLVIAITALWKGWIVPGSRVKEMQASVERDRVDHKAQLDAKDAALQRKDDLIQAERDKSQALSDSVIHEVMPALTRATDLVNALTKVVVRND